MKTRTITNLFLIIFLLPISLVFGQLTQITEPNMISEANIYRDANNVKYSELITFKFKIKMVELRRGEENVDRTKIQSTAFKNLLNGLENQYGSFVIKKSIPDVMWGDTIGINKRTGQSVRINDLSQIYRIIFNNPVPIDQVVNQLKTSSEVEYAEGPIVGYLTISPNDPWYQDQGYRWSFDVINAEGAWNITTGSPLIGVGINDLFGGVPELHQDLGYKVVWHDNLTSFGNHGVIVAGVAGAITNNSTDIASLGWNLNLLLSNWNYISLTKMVIAGADVINFSWITSYPSSSLTQAVYNALALGRILVAASGNNQQPIPGVWYPAAYNFGELGQVIAVSGTEMVNGTERFIQGFNYSPGTDPINDPTNAFIDCAAPGSNYRGLSDISPTGTKHIWSGTSISAPFVSAMVGLMLSVNSTLTPNQVYEIITRTTDKIGTNPYNSIGWNQYLGYGRIDAANAVNVATGAPSKPRGLNLSVHYTNDNGYPKLTWDLNPENNITNYLIERSINSGSYVYLGAVNSSTNQYIDYGISYAGSGMNSATYRIRAKNNLNKLSIYSLPKTIAWDDAWKIVGDRTLVTEFKLYDNYPNPFNPNTKISWQSPVSGWQTLKVYDVLGNEVATLVDEYREAGRYEVEFNAVETRRGVSLPSGIYFYRLTAGSFTEVKKMILSK
ncbi:S8 family serine peptidase [Ignavibacterium sp.]|jgi:hypothetical protein|uniref:S8 family serine peptidase n=1 Tax=Ignavibacterium sp. TaxID=2651167 RepID=UPI0025BB2B66|nr:S8 family serine peptidase [Ignavibacterium sp.]